MSQISSRRILVVEDDPGERDLLIRVFERDGYDVRTASTAQDARGALEEGGLDLMILDLGLPDADGLDLLRPLDDHEHLPVLVLTARTGLGDRILGLDSGADDYVTKPVPMPELQARVRALLRRSVPTTDVVRSGPLEMDLGTREARMDGWPLDLTRKEFDLLAHLASHPRSVFSRDDLLREVWHSGSGLQVDSTVTEHVRRLRKKLGDDPIRPRWLVTARGVGYRWEPGQAGTRGTGP